MAEQGRTPSDLYRRIAQAAAAVFIAIDLLAITLRRIRYSGDFDISIEFGRRFLAGQHLYRGGLHFPYLPAAAMFFSIFSLIPKPLAFALFYFIAIACLWLVMRMLSAMVCGADPILRDRALPIAAVTLILASHYIIRDLDDGGPNLMLLALAMGGIYYAWAGREAGSAICLGAAAALKATAAIFIPFLLWKRRWRLAAYTTAAAVFWIAMPILRMGPTNWWAHQREWFVSAAGFAAGSNAAAALYYGESNTGNQALRPAVMYFLDSLGIAARTASIAGAIAALGLLGLFCRLTVRPYGHRLDRQWLVESSGLLIMAVLLAPVTWIQHLVLLLPALYLVVADYFAGEEFDLFSKAAMALYVIFALVLNRGLIGKTWYAVLLELHVQTWCMLLIFGVLMFSVRSRDGAVKSDGRRVQQQSGREVLMANIAKCGWKLSLICAAAVLVTTNVSAQSKMEIRTGAFAPGGPIPEQYTCAGENISPALAISGVPASAKAMVLIVDDPDAPAGTFVHWVVYNIPPQTVHIDGGVSQGQSMPGGGVQGRNDFGRTGYGGPCPPPGSPHHYRFRVFALNSQIGPSSDTGPAVEQAMQGHVLASAEMVGTFGR
jgi:Raf kinase inhibitor-like YbhB/YbcL family protein